MLRHVTGARSNRGAGSGAATSVFARPWMTGGAVGVDQIRSGHRTALLAAQSKGNRLAETVSVVHFLTLVAVIMPDGMCLNRCDDS